MSSKVKLIKKLKADVSSQLAKDAPINERQRNREIVGVIKTWIDEFKIHTASKTETALALLTK